MGADFKEKAAKSFKKCWDNAAVRANTPDLFRPSAKRAPIHFEAEPFANSVLPVGASVVVRIENGKMIGRNGLVPVLVIAAPPDSLTQSMIKSCGTARAEVVSFDEISGIYEVTFH